MNLYNQCLLFVVMKDDYETDDLPHTIQEDIAVLRCLKKKLDERNVILVLHKQIKDQYQEQLDTRWHYRICACSIDIDCECQRYHEWELIPECEQEIKKLSDEEMSRLSDKERDLRVELQRLRKEIIICVKDKIPSPLKVVARKIVNKMDDLGFMI